MIDRYTVKNDSRQSGEVGNRGERRRREEVGEGEEERRKKTGNQH